MADFCTRCNMDHYFGPYSDFSYLGQPGGVLHHHPDMVVGVLCEGCGPTYVNRYGECTGGCALKHTPPGDDEVLRSAREWLDRRAGPHGWWYRLRDRLLGTPWEPGQIHYLRWRWNDWRGRVWHSGDKPLDFDGEL